MERVTIIMIIKIILVPVQVQMRIAAVVAIIAIKSIVDMITTMMSIWSFLIFIKF